MVYGSGTMQAAEGANIVLMAEDTGVHEPAGYPLHYGKEYTVPDDAPSYAELAEARGARIILGKMRSGRRAGRAGRAGRLRNRL